MFHHIWFFSMSRKSFLSTVWHYNLTAPWPTLCHCWGDRLNNPMLTTAYYCCLTWRSLGALYNKVMTQTPAKHLIGFELGYSLTPYPTEPFSLVFQVCGPLDYSPLVFNVYSSFLGCLFVFQSCFVIIIIFFWRFLPPGCLIFKWFYFSRCACLHVKHS